MRPVVLLLVALLCVPPAMAVIPTSYQASCGGTAPETRGCTTSSRIWVVPQLDLAVGEDYTGLLENRLAGDGWGKVVMCFFEQGIASMCMESAHGTLPGGLLDVRGSHECKSFDAETYESGGTGTWTCIVTDLI